MCRTLSDINRGTPCLIPGTAIDRHVTPSTRLAAGTREGRCQIGRLAGAYALARRPASFGEDSPLRHPDLFYVGLLNASGGMTPTKGGYEEFFLAWDRCRLGGCPCRLEHGMPARRTWWPWRTSPSTHHHDTVE